MHGDDDGLAATFDTVAETYARARPGYPAQLFDDLAESTGLSSASARVLEIGPGTGQATRGLLARGWQVVALEPGPNLADVARRELHGLGDVDVHVATFESWTGDDESFDLVLAATSFHWLEPSVAFSQAARLLRPGGSLAVVSTEHVLPAADGDLFFREVEDAYAAVGMSDGLGGPQPPERVPAPYSASILASGLFEAPVQRRYVWAQSYSAEEYLTLLSTYSGHIAASAQQRETLFRDIRARIDARPGRAVRKHYLTILETARRPG